MIKNLISKDNQRTKKYLDENYLRLDATNSPVTGEITFNKHITLKAGQKFIYDG